MISYAVKYVTEMSFRTNLPDVSRHDLAQQVDILTRDFLELVLSRAGVSGKLNQSNEGMTVLPYGFIVRDLPSFVAARCKCWPQ